MPQLLLVLIVWFCVVPGMAQAKVNTAKWGVTWTATDSTQVIKVANATRDSLLRLSNAARFSYDIQPLKPYKNKTPDFYLLAGLCLMLGFIRYFEPRYFSLLVGAYRNPGTGRQWHEMLQAAALPNLAMNVFFAAVTGVYIYYLSGGSSNQLPGVRTSVVLPLLVLSMLLMYAAKYAFIRFSGWAFRVEHLAEQYIFNVFLVNKIVGIVLLPFVVLIAFAGPEWLAPLGTLSGIIALALLSTRYLRSWPAFYALFEGSKFHFFTYLCASEILPMAVLVKWLLHLVR